MKNLLMSVGFLVLFWSVTIYYYLVLALNRCLAKLRQTTYSTREAHAVASRWGKALLTLTPGWNIELSGTEHLPADGQAYVIVANHESATDIMAIYFLGVQFRWLSKDSMFKLPFVGRAMRWAGYVPIKRGDRESHLQALRSSAEILADNVPMLFFPEGTRSTSGTLSDFKTGAFRLAQEAQVPILPVVLYGAGKLLKKKSICPKKATVYIKILPLVHSTEGELPNTFTQRVRQLMVAEHRKFEAMGHAAESASYANKREGDCEFACGDHSRPY